MKLLRNIQAVGKKRLRARCPKNRQTESLPHIGQETSPKGEGFQVPVGLGILLAAVLGLLPVTTYGQSDATTSPARTPDFVFSLALNSKPAPSPGSEPADEVKPQARASGTAPAGAEAFVTNDATAPGLGQAAPKKPRQLGETELLGLLTQKIQAQVGAQGEVDLAFARPWTPVAIPDAPLRLELLEPTIARLNPLLMVRFQIRAGTEVLGTWQASLQCHLWRKVLVAQNALKRGAALSETDLGTERRDALTYRDALSELPAEPAECELTENVQLGAPLTARSVRLKPVVFRGQTAEAVVRDGAMVISLKVEVLEEGAPGQMVRVRNPQSRRELRGRVENEQTIAIPL